MQESHVLHLLPSMWGWSIKLAKGTFDRGLGSWRGKLQLKVYLVNIVSVIMNSFCSSVTDGIMECVYWDTSGLVVPCRFVANLIFLWLRLSSDSVCDVGAGYTLRHLHETKVEQRLDSIENAVRICCFIELLWN